MKLSMLRKVSAVLLVMLLAACAQVQAPNHVSYELKSGMQDGKMVFIGMGGSIDGVVNPTLEAKVGETVTVTLMSGEGAEHNFALPDLSVDSAHVVGQGKTITVTFGVDHAGTFPYFCSLPGHRQAGMEGKFVATGESAQATTAAPSTSMATMAGMTASQPAPATGAATTGVDIVRDPTDLPGPIGQRGPTTVRIDLEAH